MALDIGIIDHWANNWDSSLHRASALSKVLGVGFLISAVVIASDFFVVLSTYIFVVAAIVSTRLPALKIAFIGAYPAFFALLFAFSRWDGSVLTPLVIVVRALAAAISALMLVTTTPYPAVFAVFHGLLPRAVGDGFFLTYRSIFILLRLAGNLWTALRLRGGITKGRYVKNLVNVSTGLGLLLIRGFALSQKMYDAMRVRGYTGRLIAPLAWRNMNKYDAIPLALGLATLSLASASRFVPGEVVQYNGVVFLLALVTLISAIVYVRLVNTRKPTRSGPWRR